MMKDLSRQKILGLDTKEISEIESLSKKSSKRIKRYFDNDFEYNQLPVPRSNEFLRKHISHKLPMFVLYADLIGSTKLSSELYPDELTMIIRGYCQEMAYLIEHYDGNVLKFVGDAAIGYFIANTKPGLTADNAVKCAISMIHVVENALNPVLKEKNYPELKVKITADFGMGNVILYSSNEKKAHVDIIGLAMNLAAKMQILTKPNQIVMGKEVYTRLNSRLKNYFKKVKANTSDWNYEYREKTPYSIFASTKNWNILSK